MAALTMDINTPEHKGDYICLPVAANTTIYGGALVVLSADGYAAPGTAAAGLNAIGRAEGRVVNLGAAGDEYVLVKRGIFCWGNAAGEDKIATKDIGADCYIVDDHTVALTDGGAARSRAGEIFGVDDGGVWVKI